jgi:hypothetical protein
MVRKRFEWLVGAALVLGAAGCGRGSLEPNGEDGVLMFLGPGTVLGEGLQAEVRLPRQHELKKGCRKLDLVCDRRTLEYDFDGTTLDLVMPAGFTLLGQALDASGHLLQVRCDQAPQSGPGELGVIVRDGAGAERYRDRYLLGCQRADRFEVRAPFTRYAVGSAVRLEPELRSGDTWLDGIGWRLDDPHRTLLDRAQPPLDLAAEHRALLFTAQAPGGPAVLHAGTVSAPLPFEVVPDASWTLGLHVEACSDASVHPQPTGTLADGARVGLPEGGCEYTFTPPEGEAVKSAGPCTACVDAPGLKGQLCLQLSGKSACAELGQ